MKLLFFFVFMLFSIEASDGIYISNDIFKIIIDFTDSLKTIEVLNRTDRNLYQLTLPLLNTYQRFNQEGIMYDTVGKKIFPDTTIENDIVIRYKNIALESPLIMYTFLPSIHAQNMQAVINDPLSYRSISDREKSDHNSKFKKLLPLIVYKKDYKNIRNIKCIYMNCPNLMYHMDHIKSEAHFCNQLFIHIDLSQTDYWFGIEKLLRVIPKLIEGKKIKIKFNNIGGLFFAGLKRADEETNNYVVDYMIKKLQYIEFSIDKIDKFLIECLMDCVQDQREKYILILCAAKNITFLEKNFLSKLDTLKYIINKFSLAYNEKLEDINPNSLPVFKNSANNFFNAVKEFSTEEQKLFNEIFNCDLEGKSKNVKDTIRKNEKLKFHTKVVLLFKFIFIAICFGTALNTLYNFKKCNINKKDALLVLFALFWFILSRKQHVVHF